MPTPLTFDHASRLLTHAISANLATFISGPPGIGKSTMVRTVARDLGLELRDVRVSLLDAVDLRGLPFPDRATGTTLWLPPQFLPPMGSTGRGILFLDEINAAMPNVQAACYQLVLDRRIGEYELPPGWVVCAAGNRTTDKAVAYAMPSALRNRFLTIELRHDLDGWLRWANTEVDGRRRIHPLICDFVAYRPSVLLDMPEQLRDQPFPTPRSWEFASRLLDEAQRSWSVFPPSNVDADAMERQLLHAALEGTIGHAASEFLSFIDSVGDRQFVGKFLADPHGEPIPAHGGCMFVLIMAVAERCRDNIDNARQVARILMQRLTDMEWREKFRSELCIHWPGMLADPVLREDELRRPRDAAGKDGGDARKGRAA